MVVVKLILLYIYDRFDNRQEAVVPFGPDDGCGDDGP